MLAYHIDHCESVASPRLVGVFKDQMGEGVYLLNPGETIDIPLKDQSGNNMVGIRYPGPSQNVSGGSSYIATGGNYPSLVYAVPVYIGRVPNSNFYLADQIMGILESNFNLATCSYTASKPVTPTDQINAIPFNSIKRHHEFIS